MDSFKIAFYHPEIFLCCANISMSQHLLHISDIGIVVNQRRGECVPEDMRRDFLGYPCFLCVCPDKNIHQIFVYGLTESIYKHNPVGFVCPGKMRPDIEDIIS